MNDNIEKLLNNDPLILFSFETLIQVETLSNLASEIAAILDTAIEESDRGEVSFDGKGFQRVHGLFWLWTIGAFEVVRTMVSAKKSFTSDKHSELSKYKSKLVKLRVPFAKQQFAGRKEATAGQVSVLNFDGPQKDFSFSVEEEEFWVRKLMQEFNALIRSINRDDIYMPYHQAISK